MDFLAEYGLFLAKSITIAAAVLMVVVGALVSAQRLRPDEGGQIEVRKLNERFDAMRNALRAATLDPKERKRLAKEERAQKRAAGKARKGAGDAAEPPRPRVYVLDFHGDIRAHAVQSLREEVSAVLTLAGPGDGVLLRLESGGGMVHAYGLAAEQLARLRDHGVRLTVCVDKVAASGGYLMACVADEIVATPFAVLGSIGVVAQLPNFHRLLRKHDVDYEMLTAGQYKRTLTVFGHNTEEGRRKFAEELEETHALFKRYVARYRPELDVEAVATGETWFGSRALELALVDRLGTSDQWLQDAAAGSDLVEVRYIERKPLAQRLGAVLESAVERGALRVLERLSDPGERFR